MNTAAVSSCRLAFEVVPVSVTAPPARFWMVAPLRTIKLPPEVMGANVCTGAGPLAAVMVFVALAARTVCEMTANWPAVVVAGKAIVTTAALAVADVMVGAMPASTPESVKAARAPARLTPENRQRVGPRRWVHEIEELIGDVRNGSACDERRGGKRRAVPGHGRRSLVGCGLDELAVIHDQDARGGTDRVRKVLTERRIVAPWLLVSARR